MRSIATVLLLPLFLPMLAQGQKSCVELVSLLDIGFYDQNGNFMADGLCLVFPPEGEAKYELVVRDGAGAVKGKANLQHQKWGQYPVFDGLSSLGVPILQLGAAGDYVMSVDVNGEPVTSVPFKMEVAESGDPFNPRKTFTREGPWRKLAFLSSVTGKPDQPLVFHFWTNQREIPKEGSKFPQANVKVLSGDEVVGLYKSPVSVAGTKWRRYNRNLVGPGGPNAKWLSLERLQSRDGDYRIVVEAGDKAIKTFALKVTGGKIQAHPRTSFGIEPRTDYIVPKWIDRTSGSAGSYVQNDVFWLQAQ